MSDSMTRRDFMVKTSAAGLVVASSATASQAGEARPNVAQPARADKPNPAYFQIACMTLPYAPFPLQRALTGLRNAGYQHVAWGTSHARWKTAQEARRRHR